MNNKYRTEFSYTDDGYFKMDYEGSSTVQSGSILVISMTVKDPKAPRLTVDTNTTNSVFFSYPQIDGGNRTKIVYEIKIFSRAKKGDTIYLGFGDSGVVTEVNKKPVNSTAYLWPTNDATYQISLYEPPKSGSTSSASQQSAAVFSSFEKGDLVNKWNWNYRYPEDRPVNVTGNAIFPN